MHDESSKNTGPTSADGTTCGPSRLPMETGELTLCAGGSRARTSAILEDAPASKANGLASGRNSRGSSAFYDLDSRSWKTWQRSVFGGWVEFSGTFPRSGMTRNGRFFPLRMSKRRISGNGCSYWPTLVASNRRHLGFSLEANIKQLRRNQRDGFQSGPGSGSFVARVIDELGGYPTIGFAELLMGFPLNWTLCDGEPSEMPLSPRSPSGSDGESLKA